MTWTHPTQRFLAALALVVGALPVLAPAPGAAADVRNPEIVVYRHQVTNAPGQTRAREHSLGFTATHGYRHALEGFSAKLTPGQVAALRDDPDVAAVVPDVTVRAESAPLAAGETLPTGVQRIGASRAGRVRAASDVGVAVLDTGIDLSNPDLNADAGTNCVGDGPPDDDNGHGTHVAGTIGARNDGSGVVGVAPGTKLYAVKVLGANGAGTTSSVLCGLDWVLAHASALNIRVTNMSLGSPGLLGNCQTDPERAAICALTAAGVTVVAAAGNEHDAITSANHGHVPAGYPEVLTATAIADTDGQPGGSGGECADGTDDAVDDFSNYAATSADAAHTIAAPGDCIVSDAPDGGTATMSGTSMASAHVAGAAALCLDEAGTPGPCADKTAPQIIAELRQVAQDGATPSNGFDGDPLHAGLRYYGYLVRAGEPPDVTTAAATSVEETAATLPGTVTAHGLPAQWWAELGTRTDYGMETPHQSGDLGDAAADVQAAATGLDPGTTYHYRLVTLVDGWTTHGADMTFTTPGTAPPPPPDTVVTGGPPAVSTSDVAQITFTGDPAGAVTSYQCRLDTDVWSPCSSPADYDGLGDGPHRLDVRALGAGGRPDASPAGVSWTIDRTPPRTRIAAAPSLETTTTDAVFALAADEPSTFECSLDGAPWSPCGSVVALHALAPGSHTLAARATDAAGLVDASPALYSWRVLVTSAQPAGPAKPPEGPPDPGSNPFVAAPPVPLPQLGRLTVSRARLDRRGRIVLTLVCRAARCTGRLSLRDRGRAIGSATVQVPRGATRTVAIRATRRPRTITLELSGQGTSLERSSVRLQR